MKATRSVLIIAAAVMAGLSGAAAQEVIEIPGEILLSSTSTNAQQAGETNDFPFTEEEANYLLFWELVTDMEIYVQARECAQRGALDPSIPEKLSERIGQKHLEAGNELVSRMQAYAEGRLLPQFAAASKADIENGCRSLEDTVRQN